MLFLDLLLVASSDNCHCDAQWAVQPPWRTWVNVQMRSSAKVVTKASIFMQKKKIEDFTTFLFRLSPVTVWRDLWRQGFYINLCRILWKGGFWCQRTLNKLDHWQDLALRGLGHPYPHFLTPVTSERCLAMFLPILLPPVFTAALRCCNMRWGFWMAIDLGVSGIADPREACRIQWLIVQLSRV